MKDCIFCRIIKEELPAKTIWEDDNIKVIMNINPCTNGHLLVIPKKHMVDIRDTDEKIIMHCLQIIKNELYPRLKEKLQCEGLTIAQNNELGQEIKHYHIHLIPRYQEDDADFKYNTETLEELEEIYYKLQ